MSKRVLVGLAVQVLCVALLVALVSVSMYFDYVIYMAKYPGASTWMYVCDFAE